METTLTLPKYIVSLLLGQKLRRNLDKNTKANTLWELWMIPSEKQKKKANSPSGILFLIMRPTDLPASTLF